MPLWTKSSLSLWTAAPARTSLRAAMKILFVCKENACRSLMAEELGRWLDLDEANQYFSAGIALTQVHEGTHNTFIDRGIVPLEEPRAKSIAEALEAAGGSVDLVVTLCEDSERDLPEIAGATRRLHWPMPDPREFEGSAQEVRSHFADIRDRIEREVSQLLDEA